jgi:hypothetical protein
MLEKIVNPLWGHFPQKNPSHSAKDEKDLVLLDLLKECDRLSNIA